MKRFWDKNKEYLDGELKEYKFWSLEVSYKQHTFGNFIIFCKRKGVEKLSELSDKEILELKEVMQEIELALIQNKTFNPIRFNYWQMGNKVHHLHIHGIPRYNCPKKFFHKIWLDKNPNQPPIWSNKIESSQTIRVIRDEIKKFL